MVARMSTRLRKRRCASISSRCRASDSGTPSNHSSREGTRLLHRRNDEAGVLAHAAFGPARRHRLDPRIEAHAFRAVLVDVAERGTLPAAEGVIGERYWDR